MLVHWRLVPIIHRVNIIIISFFIQRISKVFLPFQVVEAQLNQVSTNFAIFSNKQMPFMERFHSVMAEISMPKVVLSKNPLKQKTSLFREVDVVLVDW